MSKSSTGIFRAAFSLAFSAGCALQHERAPEPIVPQAPLTRAQAAASWSAAEQVFTARCVVCHGCYDAPCQLKLDTFSGIARGATGLKVYDGARLKPAPLTRIDIDAHDAATWRQKGFHPVLPEDANPEPRQSLLLRMLALKRAHPLPAEPDLRRDFTLELDRKETCADDAHFEQYAKEHPLWGMPYGMPALGDSESAALENWVRDGAPYAEPEPISSEHWKALDAWESFLNQPSLKERLMSRYIYEHLFLASVFFKDIDSAIFFRLVRSRTPPGQAPDEIATRRPFDDPATEHLYYRFVRRTGPALSKTHMVYALDQKRLALYRKLFLEPAYTVDALPSYLPEIGANPFRAFAAIPARSRYELMLTEAEFTIMGFIKGPVCRGQVALNVIQDRFWILFVDPDAPWMNDETSFLAAEGPDLDMPAEHGSASLSVLWHHYDKPHDRYMRARQRLLARHLPKGADLTSVWDGDGTNSNAALTVFRHFDTASVVQGLIGGPPQTAWVLDYPTLERIHYLLVAGFDVFGNVGHQVSTRVYMDFLRMEGESGFMMLLPPERRTQLAAHWYRGVTGDEQARVASDLIGFTAPPHIGYRTATPELELFELLRARVGPALARRYELPAADTLLNRLAGVHGVAASLLPEASFLTIRDGEQRTTYSLLRESAHTNVAHLFSEDSRRIKEEDRLTVVPGFLSSYPNALFEVERKDLSAFVDAASSLDSEAAYRSLRLRFGVLRNSPRFWPHSDEINAANHQLGPVDSGLLDYNHLEPL